jgi:ATP-dependent exoDNAse (exonuclease V) beta subunit
VVVLPQLSVALARVDTAVLVQRGDPTAPPSRVACGASSVLRELSPELAALYAQQRARAVEESLGLLYVAMTRAARELHLVIDPAASNERRLPSTMAGLVRAAWTSERKAPPNTVLFDSETRAGRAQHGGI